MSTTSITSYHILLNFGPASVAQLDANLTGDQEVVGLTPAEVGNILSWRLIMKCFLRSFSPADLRKAVVSFWRKNVHNTG